ncbi:MAG: type II toxin-antitoxin system RelE/ParE family toxin [Arcobacteraceae bacterium]|nr:type II toxin-antitoxin system RelE/ParE family toxin [Arcobacteraceae bacterium]
MIVEKSDRFKNELKIIVEFIALDSVVRAIKFYDEVTFKIQNIPHSPYAYRKKAKDENLRELIFKGYTIPFEIDTINQKIIILGIFNQNLWN